MTVIFFASMAAALFCNDRAEMAMLNWMARSVQAADRFLSGHGLLISLMLRSGLH